MGYKSHYAAVRNGVNVEGGLLGNINVDITVTDQNKGIEMTSFDFIIQDSLTGDELILDEFALNLYDFDVNIKQNLNERACINLHEFYPEHSVMPEGKVTTTTEDKKDCNGNPHP